MPNRILILVCTCFFVASVSAGTTRQWIPTTGGSWNTPGNWSGGLVPVAGDTADFNTVNITADAIVTLDGNQAVDAIIFGDTNTSSAGSWIIRPGSGGSITLSGTATITVNALGTGKSAQLDVALLGSAGLTKAGTGTLTLSAVSSYTGATVVSAGALKLAGAPSVVGINYFKITGDADSQLSSGNTYTHAINPSGGNEIVNSIPFTGAGVGSVTTLTSKTYTQAGSTITIANTIGTSDFGALAIGTNLSGWSGVTGQMLNFYSHFNYNTAPLRTVVLNGLQSNTWYDVRLYEKQWDTSVGRTYSVGYNVGNDASTEATSPTIDQNHPESTPALAALTIGQQSAWSMSYVYKTGAAQTSIALAINNSTAATYHFYGLSNQVALGGDNRLPTTTALSIATGATLDLAGGSQQLASLSDSGGGGGSVTNSTSGSPSTLTLSPGSGSTTFSGVIGGGAGAISVVKSGAGTQILSGTNTYTGTTTVSAGTLQIGDGVNDGSISTSTSIINNAALVYNVVGTTQSYGNVISGTGSLSKTGVGTLTLSGSNTYSGATTVNAGTLLCTNTSGSATGTGNVTVNVNSTIAGTGRVSGSLTVNGGTVSPGNGGVGTLTSGPAVFNATSTLTSEVGTVSDLLVVQGALTIDGTVNVTLAGGGGAGVYTLVSYTGALTDSALLLGTTPAGYTPSVVAGGGLVQLTLNAGTSTTLTASPVTPTVFGQSVTFTANVSATAPAVGAPTGSVVFTIDGVAQPPLALVNGSVSFSLSTLSVGAHSIQANYGGVTAFNASNTSLAHTVNKASTTSVLASNANPSPDGLVTITATVAAVAPGGGIPTGTVSFSVDGVTQPAVTLVNGVATLQLMVSAGSHTIQAQYSGSAEHTGSNGVLTQLVKPTFTSPPTLTPNPAVAGQAITGTAAVGNATVTWSWGDGTSSSGATASHTYSTPGIFTAIVTATADGETITQAIQIFIGLSLQGTGGGAAIPGVTGILVGGQGAGAAQGGSGKIVCNYVKREKTMYSGSLGSLTLPTTLTQDQLTAKNGTLILGNGALAQQFSFILAKNGRGRATGLPQISFSVKKKTFKFKARRAELTNLTEALGAPQQFGVKKGQVVTLLVPATLQIGMDLFIAMTFQVTYQQINSGGGKGAL